MNAPTTQQLAVGNSVRIRDVNEDDTPDVAEKIVQYKKIFAGEFRISKIIPEGENQVVRLNYPNSEPVMVKYGNDAPEPLEISGDWLTKT